MGPKIILIVVAAAFAAAAGLGGGEAQAAKKCPRTMEQCLQSCVKAGGRTQYCPKYCEDKERTTGCP